MDTLSAHTTINRLHYPYSSIHSIRDSVHESTSSPPVQISARGTVDKNPPPSKKSIKITFTTNHPHLGGKINVELEQAAEEALITQNYHDYEAEELVEEYIDLISSRSDGILWNVEYNAEYKS